MHCHPERSEGSAVVSEVPNSSETSGLATILPGTLSMSTSAFFNRCKLVTKSARLLLPQLDRGTFMCFALLRFSMLLGVLALLSGCGGSANGSGAGSGG